MKKNGFTLVELLTVIIILSLLMAIAVPSSIAISVRIKEKLLKTKINLAEKNAILWSQDHKSCFTGTCDNNPLTSCDTTETDKITCSISLERLADSGYLDFDDETDRIIKDPTNNDSNLNNHMIKITYNSKTKMFTIKN